MRNVSRLTMSALALAIAATAGCKKNDNAAVSADSSTMSDRVEAVKVTGVDLGRGIGADKRVTQKTSDLSTRDTVYASVMTTGSGPASLTAHWTFEDGQVVDETTQNISPTGPAVTEFHIAKPSGWPAGKYKLDIRLNGQSVETEEFEIK